MPLVLLFAGTDYKSAPALLQIAGADLQSVPFVLLFSGTDYKSAPAIFFFNSRQG
jgi:hypothetical protein